MHLQITCRMHHCGGGLCYCKSRAGRAMSLARHETVPGGV